MNADASNSTTPLADEIAVVTGAGQGVGLGVALALAKAGAAVAVVDKIADRAEAGVASVEAAGGVAGPFVGDVADPEAVQRLISDIVTTFGTVDILVNNAQTVVPGPVLTITPGDAEVVWSSGLLGTLNTMWACRPHLIGGGRIINVVSSVMLKQSTAGFALYTATKSAIRSVTRTAAVEWSPHGIRVNALSPQTTSPSFTDWSAANPDAAAAILSEIPLGYFGDPEGDVGPVAVFLASPAAHYVTGSMVLVDGGRGHLR